MNFRCGHLTKLGGLISCILLTTATFAWAQGPARKIVVFQKDFVNQSAQQALVKKFGAEGIKHLPLVNGMAVILPAQAEKALQQRGEVLRIDEDAIVHALKKPADKPGGGKPGNDNPPPPQPAEELPWGVDRIDAEWADSTGVGVKVAVLDTGIEYTHPDLANNCKGGINIINSRKSYMDDNGHGTHVAGIIAAEADNGIGVVGVAPEAWLYGVKVLTNRGSGRTSDIIDGLDWCIANEMDIVNMSLGLDVNVLSLKEACDAAYDAGLILVAAAGNDGHLADPSVDYPGAYDSVIAVAATDINDQQAYFSSYGPGFQVEIAAPGVNILSTYKDGTYATLDGTSMACPHVVGTYALNLSADIFATAEGLPPTGIDIYTGVGLVDAEKATNGTSNGDN